jgi:hypothetical protein
MSGNRTSFASSHYQFAPQWPRSTSPEQSQSLKCIHSLVNLPIVHSAGKPCPTGLETVAPSKSNPSTGKGWTEEEVAAFDAIVDRLKHLRDGQPEEALVVGFRRAIRRALKNFGARRVPMIPFLERNNAINRILGKCRHRLLGPKRAA